ncbi:MAG: hypothetical protein H7Z14_07260 [Anaerolineae bacterium]|nr:hypothetical protein [Phycisphaerae bacterium]
MGYLRQPIRRKAARAEKLAHFDAARNIDPADWLTADLSVLPARGTFLRFIVFDLELGWTGVFQGRWMIRESAELPDSVQSCYRENRNWMNRHLHSPRHVNPESIFWFRAEAAECIDRIRELIELYRVAGHEVRMQATRDPGYIVYQDEHQIAATPQRQPRRGRVTTSKC